MQLQKLEIFGFKSFKNKTVLEFDNDGITGVVGPNGCGKSNVVDAFLWVMGETSPKHLRSSSLSDVIFSGTHQEPPSPMAEVSLTLGKGDTQFPEKYNQFSEIMITRRSFREGKTEYFINQQACLLRDIKEIFMDTGAGCRGFSIIEQESIEKLITAKPHERRFIIEEVAGITKFKTRKHESNRKLELVKQNLKRLDDVLKTQEKQLKNLEQQAKKAEKYRELKARIKNMEIEVFYRYYETFSQEQMDLKKHYAEQKQEKSQLENKITEWEASLKQIEADLQKQELTVEKDKDYVAALNYKIIERTKEVEKIENTIHVYNKNIEAINKSKRELLEEETKLLDEETKIKSILAKIDSSLLENYNPEVVSKYIETTSNFIETKLNEKVQKESAFEANNKQIEWIEAEQTSLNEDQTGVETKFEKTAKQKDEILKLLQKQEQMKLDVTQDLDNLEGNVKLLENKKAQEQKEIESLKQNISLLQYKMEEIQKIIQNFKNLQEGSYHLSSSQPETFKPLFKNLKIEPDFEQALMSVLGVHSQALISSNLSSIEQGIKELKAQKKGKCSFLSSLPSETSKRPSEEELKQYPAFICYLEKKLTFDLDTELLKPLLSNTALVKDLASAIQLKEQYPTLQFVTQEGDLVTKESIVYAGSDLSEKESNLFQLHNQVEANQTELKRSQTDLQIKQERWDKQCKQLEKIKGEFKNLKDKKEESSQSFNSNQRTLELLEKEHKHILEHKLSYNKKWHALENQKENLKVQTLVLEEEIQILKKTLNEHKENFSYFKTADNDYKEIKMQILQNSKDHTALEQKISMLSNLVMQSRSPSDQNEQEIHLETDISQLIEREKQKVQDAQKEISLLEEEKAQLEKSIYENNQAREAHKINKEKISSQLKRTQDRVQQISLSENSYESEQEKLNIKKQNIKERLLSEHQFDIEKNEFKPQYEAKDLDTLNDELVNWKEKLERTSTVNLLAIKEYEEISKDYEFLMAQKEDLMKSKKDLLKVISYIDSICEKRFLKMLEEINKRFSKIFPIIFEGDNAEAKLVLHQDADSDSDEEPGLDIIVRPPGKKVQSVTLLSRGEKALTSICLIYALFLVKPSPFCIVDEIDSPLDDANVFRLISVLKEMSRKSQVVVITHNKYTMKSCKKLYGVTMEKLGVSQLVSVDTSESHKPLEHNLT